MASNTVTDRSCPPCTHDSHNTHTQSGIRLSVHQWVCTHKHLHPQVGGHTQVHTCTHPHHMGCIRCAHTRDFLVGCALTPHGCASHSQACTHTIPMWVYTASHVHTWVSPPHVWDAGRFSTHPSRCLRPPPPTAQLTRQMEGYRAAVKTLVFPLPLGYF